MHNARQGTGSQSPVINLCLIMLFHVRYKIPQGFYNKALLKWMKNNCETLPVTANDNTDANCSDRPLRAVSMKTSFFLAFLTS